MKFLLLLLFTIVSVMENSSIPETDKGEKESITKDPDFTIGKCRLPSLDSTLEIIIS
jgi:hypothetical protein